MMDYKELLPIIIALVGSAGLWKFLSQKATLASEEASKKDDQRAEFNETLKNQVASLDAKVDKLLSEKDDLLNAIADLRAELAEAKVTVQHLEAIVRSR
tara:strand:+ start:762 stop:1058 length:297 start_codon:yes stop_codon:yes gene_type:complete